MKDGNWIPMSKALLKKLPKDRPFSEVEAAFSLQVAHDCKQEVSVAGLAARWAWSRGRVKRFIVEMGGAVAYQKDTSNLQNQRGQIVIQIPDRYRADNEQIRLFENNNLPSKTDRYRADSEQITDRSRYTINNPNPNPNKKDLVPFDDFYSIYPKKRDKEEARKVWEKLKVDSVLFEKIKTGVEDQKNSEDWKKEKGKYIPNPSTWLRRKRWNDELEVIVENDQWQ